MEFPGFVNGPAKIYIVVQQQQQQEQQQIPFPQKSECFFLNELQKLILHI